MLYALIQRCYGEYGLTLNLQDECEQHLAAPSAYFRSHGGDLWVLTDEEGVVRATAALYVHLDRAKPVGELKCMYVDPMWRRRGIGRAMTEHIMREAWGAACAAMELWSDTRFEAAHRMYESLGFERFDRRDLVDSNQSSEWGYRRELQGER